MGWVWAGLYPGIDAAFLRQWTYGACRCHLPERESFIDNLLVRIHFIIEMIRWTGLAPWESEFPFPGSLTSTFLGHPPPTLAITPNRPISDLGFTLTASPFGGVCQGKSEV